MRKESNWPRIGHRLFILLAWAEQGTSILGFMKTGGGWWRGGEVNYP